MVDGLGAEAVASGDIDAVASLDALLTRNEDWLMRRVLDYSAQHGFTKYTSTLEEAWRVSISGLSRSIVLFVQARGFEPDLQVDEDVTHDPAVAFGILEAQAHRSRGVSLQMFMSLMKYYRRTFLDLAHTGDSDETIPGLPGAIHRFFDRVEIGYCVEWSGLALDFAFRELQDASRGVMNEKNKYLTLFQSLDTPVFLLDDEGRVDNLNQSASRLLGVGGGTGEGYYSGVGVGGQLEILADDVSDFLESDEAEMAVERELLTSAGRRHFAARFKRMLDVSGRYAGATVTLADVTDLKASKNHFRMLSTVDDLTGVSNRRHFLDLARREYERAVRLSHPMAIALMDVDKFKQVNDTWGHAAGDQVLRGISDICRVHVRGIDVFARFGGDEFALLLPETSLSAAHEAVDRVRSALEARPLEAAGRPVKTTLSAGVSSLHKPDESLDSLLARADRAMYVAKSAGGNRVEAESSDECPGTAARP